MIKGRLQLNSQGRYEVQGKYFTSGDAIDIFHDAEWIDGRIEFSHETNNYYFLNEDRGIFIFDLKDKLVRI